MQNNTHKEITKALEWRYATQVFDKAKKMNKEDLHTILEAGRLSPSSFGTEPWRFIVVENPELRVALRTAAFGQAKVTDAQYLVIIARRTDVRAHITNELIERTAEVRGLKVAELDGLKKMVDGAIAMRDDAALDAWVRSQVYIPLGAMVLAASLLGIDNGPMEGFDPAKVDEILGLKEKHLTATTMLALGYRGDDAAALRKKVRRSVADAVEFI